MEQARDRLTRNEPSVRVRIIELNAREDFIDRTAELLHDTFRGRSQDWQDLESARQEVLESLEHGKISRVAVDDAEDIAGWIGAMPLYGGNVWEIHPLVVAEPLRRRGIGRLLLQNVEDAVRAKGAYTLFAGSDDENDETSLSGQDLYPDVPGAIRTIRNLRGHPYEFYIRVGFTIVGVIPDANGPGKPEILLAKRVR